MKREISEDERALGSTTVLTEKALDLPEGQHSAGPPNKAALVDNAYLDYCNRRDHGEILDPDEYCARFPSLKSSLYRLIQAHLFIEENPFLMGDLAPVAWPAPGSGFLGVHLVKELGRGSFARVYLAREPKLGDRLVAVKIALHGAAEAKILGRISHPNVVPVYSVQEDIASGMTMVCMPYVGRATLCDVFDAVDPNAAQSSPASLILQTVADDSPALEESARRRQPARVLRVGHYVDGIRWIGAQLADALEFLHARGIFHRDIKPSNVLISPAGVPMLLDFNLSADVKLATTRVGGTYPYMAPETLQPVLEKGYLNAGALDGRSDIFSLGVILYELATGMHPFGPLPLKTSAAALCSLLFERQKKGARHASEANPRVDREFGDLIQRCLAFDPQDRPANAGDAAKVLWRAFLPLGQARGWVRKHTRTLLAASVLFAAIGGSAAAVAVTRAPYSERQYAAAIAEYRAGDYEHAVQLLTTSLEVDAKNPATWFARGRAFQQLAVREPAYYKQALGDFRQAEALSPDGRNRAAMGFISNCLGEDKQAIAAYVDAIKAGQATAEVYNNLGYSLWVRKQPAALQNFELAIQANPDLGVVYHNRAAATLDQVLGKSAHLSMLNQTLAIMESSDYVLTAKKMKADPEAERAKKLTERDALRDEIPALLKRCRDDIQTALKLQPASADLHFCAAQVHAVAAGSEPKWVEKAIEHLTAAVDHGLDPRKLAENQLFSPLRNDARFQVLITRPPVYQTAPAPRRFVDPIKDFPG